MLNLYEETTAFLREHGKTWEDVWYVVADEDPAYNTVKGRMPVARFKALAKKIDYDDGFGGNEISLGLKLVGAGWWMERHEYDGSEWWEFKARPSFGDYEGTEDIRMILTHCEGGESYTEHT